MRRNVVCFLLCLFFYSSSFIFCNDTLKTKYKFIFFLNDIECTSCFLGAISENINIIKKSFSTNSDCFIIFQVKKRNDTEKYKKILKNVTILETIEKLDLADYGINNFPALFIYNEYGILIKIYDNITQIPPLLNSKFFENTTINLNELNKQVLEENDTIPYVSIGKSFITDNFLHLIDYSTFTFHKININTGKIIKTFSIAGDTTIGNALLDSEFRTEKYTDDNKYNYPRKIYDCFLGKNNEVNLIINSLTGYTSERKYQEEYRDTVIFIKDIACLALLSIDTNNDKQIKKFDIDTCTNGDYAFTLYEYFNKDHYLANVVPLNSKMDSTFLLAKFNCNLDLNNYSFFYTFAKNKNIHYKTSNFYNTSKFVDTNNDIYICNTDLEIFSKLSCNGNKKYDFKFMGTIANLTNSLSNDTNISNAVKTNGNIKAVGNILNLNDTLFLLSILYYDTLTYEKKTLCMQAYSKKNGSLVKEKIFRISKDRIIDSFILIGIYKKQVAYLCKSENNYEIYFIPFINQVQDF